MALCAIKVSTVEVAGNIFCFSMKHSRKKDEAKYEVKYETKKGKKKMKRMADAANHGTTHGQSVSNSSLYLVPKRRFCKSTVSTEAVE